MLRGGEAGIERQKMKAEMLVRQDVERWRGRNREAENEGRNVGEARC